ncbi:MAG: hypothetical protein R3A78_05520 [Polyangiales bacterium]|nr:hypothetical protein [Myxococcales bacterium]
MRHTLHAAGVPVLAIMVLASGCSCDDDGSKGTRDGGSSAPLDADTDDGANNGTLDGSGGNGKALDVHVVITGDNAYGFGYGSTTSLANYFNGIEDNSDDIFVCSAACDASTPCAVGACDTFGTCNEDRSGPETYVVPGSAAVAGDYLYVIAWSDDAVTQGVIGQFSAADGSKVVRTGASTWQVCATGVDYDIPGDDPSESVINEWLVRCNNGEGLSKGWVGTTANAEHRALAVLEPPLTEPPQFAPLCRKPASQAGDAIDAEAKWIWFDDDVTDNQSPFVSTGDPRGEFYIFRLQISEVLVIL